MPETQEQKWLLEEFEKSAQYVDDILHGKKTFAEAAKVSPEELEEFFVRGQRALQLEDFSKAEELFTSLLVLNPKDTRAALGLGGALEGQGKFELAVPVYVMVMASTLFDPVAPFRAGICLMNIGKKDDAIKAFGLAAECEGEIKNPKKLVYVEQAKGLLESLTKSE